MSKVGKYNIFKILKSPYIFPLSECWFPLCLVIFPILLKPCTTTHIVKMTAINTPRLVLVLQGTMRAK